MSVTKHKELVSLTLFFIIWIIFLLVLAIFSSRKIYFFDALSQTDVTSQYQAVIPVARYFIEPLAGISFLLSNFADWILTIIVCYALIRIGYVLLQKKEIFNSEKFKLIAILTRNFLSFVLIVLSLTFSGVLVFLLIGYSLEGILFFDHSWQTALQTGLIAGFLLILAKLSIVIIKLVHPRLRFNYKRKHSAKSASRKILGRTGTEIKYFFTFILLFASLSILLMASRFPTYTIQAELGEDEFLFDFHVHTRVADGFLTPAARVDYYIQHGIAGAAFSEQNSIEASIQAQKYVEKNQLDFIVIMAGEYFGPGIHLNYYGVNETIVSLEYQRPGGPLALNVSDMIQYVHSKSGWVFVNHYDSNATAPFSYIKLKAWGVDGFQIINYAKVYPEARDFCLNNNLTCIAGSDIHTNEELHTFVKLQLDDPTNKTIANIFHNLARNDHETINVTLYPPRIKVPDALSLFAIVEDLGNYFLNLDGFQILSWMVWSSVGFVSFLILLRLIKRADLKYLKAKIGK